MALTSFFEKENNIKIEQGNPYCIILDNGYFSVEILEKNYIKGKNQVETARIESYYDMGGSSLRRAEKIYKFFVHSIYEMNLARYKTLNIFVSFPENKDLEREIKIIKGKFNTDIFTTKSLFAISKGATYYGSSKINDSNKSMDNPHIYHSNVYQSIDNNIFFKTNEKSEKYNAKIIACIDFGTSGTDYCFAFNTTGNIDIIHCGLPGTEGMNSKSPSEIIIDSDFNTKAFGIYCKDYISQIKEDEYYFKNIKMHLYENSFEIQPQNSQEKFDINIIISKILTEVKKEALKKIKTYDSNINENDIKWVVTVPAIWSDVSKQIMFDASLNAGLIQKGTETSLFLCYEPEAAAFYCQQEGISIPENKPYIVCDLGGGTADIVCHMKIRTNNKIKIKEVHEPVGGPYGANEINKEIFKKIIIPFFGKDVYENTLKTCKGEDYKELFDFEYDIQKFKESLSLKFDGIFQRKKIEDSNIFAESENFTLESFINEMKVQCKIAGPFKLECTLFKYFTESTLKELLNNFNKENNNLNITVEVKKKRNEEKWFINIPYEILLDITIDFVDKTCEKIKEILDYPGDMDINSIDSILYVGGYFSSEVVYWLFKKKLIKIFKNKGLNSIKHIRLKEPKLAVVKGATLFGLSPDLISSRKSDVTLGIKCIKDGKFFFDRFLNVGDDIYPEKEEKHSFKMHGNQFAIFELLKCKIKNPDPFDESLFTHHCTLIPIDIGVGHGEGETIELRMKIGTFINCIGYYQNEEKINVRVDFISNISHTENNDFDILYMIDGTGSMKEYIEAAKKKCIEISEELERIYIKKLNFKYGAIFYRDPIDEHNDKHDYYDLDDTKNLKEKIQNVKAYGGGDSPEDWVGAFKIALDTNKIKWRKGNKLIIHIADAPAHGDEFAGKPNYTDEGPKLIEQIKKCAKQEIKIFGLFIGQSAENSFQKFKEYYESNDEENKGLYKVVNFNQGEGKDIAEKFKSLVLQAVHTIEPIA